MYEKSEIRISKKYNKEGKDVAYYFRVEEVFSEVEKMKKHN